MGNKRDLFVCTSFCVLVHDRMVKFKVLNCPVHIPTRDRNAGCAELNVLVKLKIEQYYLWDTFFLRY